MEGICRNRFFIAGRNLVASLMSAICCKQCGLEIEEGRVFFTPINKEGPLCLACIEIEREQEADDNGQFGLGA
jgi:hypothetical protein